jgi:hypothetical protein
MTPLCTIDDVKGYLGLSSSFTADDALLSRLVSASSQQFIDLTGNEIASGTYTESFSGWDMGRQSGYARFPLGRFPVVSVSGVLVDGQPVLSATSPSGSGYLQEYGSVAITPDQAPRLYDWNVSITYTAGYASVPEDVRQAVIELACLKYRDRQHIGHQSDSIGGMSVTYLPSVIPQSVQVVVDAYRRRMS